MVTDLVTAEKILPVPIQQEELSLLVDRDLIKVAALDRTHGSGHLFTGLIQGFGLKSGALASSAAWDTSDIIVVGTSDADMALAVNRVIALQGAAVLCNKGKIIAELALPIFGLMSNAPMEEIAARVKEINEKANELEVPFPDPLLTLITLTGAAIPYLRICDEGLVNLKDGKRRNLFSDND
jgi:adenine deaminase